MVYVIVWLYFFSGNVYASLEQQAAVWTQSDVARVFAGGDLHVPMVSSCYSIPRLKDDSGENTPFTSPNVGACPVFPVVRSVSSSSVSLYNQPISVEEGEPKARSESTLTHVGSPTDSYLPTVTFGSPKDAVVGVDFVRVIAGRGRRVLQSPIVHVVPGFPGANAAFPLAESSADNNGRNERRTDHRKNEKQFLQAVRNALADVVDVESRSNSSSELSSQRHVSEELIQSPNAYGEYAFPTTLDHQSGINNVEDYSKKSPRHSGMPSSVLGEVSSQRHVSEELIQSPNAHGESAFPTTLDHQSGINNVEDYSKKSPRHSGMPLSVLGEVSSQCHVSENLKQNSDYQDEPTMPGFVPEQVTAPDAQSVHHVGQALNPVPQPTQQQYGCFAGLIRCLRGQSDTQAAQ